jgi:hypothetical protein
MGGKLSSLKCQVLPPQNLSKKTQEPLPGMLLCTALQSKSTRKVFFGQIKTNAAGGGSDTISAKFSSFVLRKWRI